MGDKKKTVLIVDDDVDFLTQYRLVLEADGYSVITAEGRKEAEDILKTTRPDVAIVDLMLEELDAGFVLCYHIKKMDPSIPVILATSVTGETGLEFDATTREEQSWLKADTVLSKPVRAEQITQEVARLLRL